MLRVYLMIRYLDNGNIKILKFQKKTSFTSQKIKFG